ncbi:3-keto-disaccharide hydrolase [Terrimonas pollutisoli]|uniref:3-keto-disaccharide hydrolase n=1 Tax=Terrimonas pollutisoli TaxID=3034147 RepID=UPI0023ECAAD6|nr:DUF1080 domain-containing protein [Terrimonas sp. H1YJ31]
MKKNSIYLISLFLTTAFASVAQQETREQQAKKTEVWTPVPPVITPSEKPGAPPSDAIILFSGDSLTEWVSSRDTTKPAGWIVSGDVLMVNKPAGTIQTKRRFTDYQLHIEWRIPKNITGSGQGRGNSGVFLGGWGKGDEGYEIQVLDSYKSETYTNGQAGSIYKQHIPLVNVNRPPGEWNVYDIVWTAPRFNNDGSLKSPARVTAFLNGALVQNNVEVKGDTRWIGTPEYHKHGPLPIKLQSHGDPSEPISFRNIWVRIL